MRPNMRAIMIDETGAYVIRSTRVGRLPTYMASPISFRKEVNCATIYRDYEHACQAMTYLNRLNGEVLDVVPLIGCLVKT
jgi:hypothetical protein